MAGVESLRFCIPFSYRAMYKCLLIIIIIKITNKLARMKLSYKIVLIKL